MVFSEVKVMKRSCFKYLILILSLILMLAPAMTVYADGPSADSGSDAGLTGEEYRADAEAPEHGSGEDLSDTDSDGSADGQPQEAETFTVRWMLSEEDTEPLELDEKVEAGSLPSFEGEEPEKEADEEFTYEFAGWAEKPDEDEALPADELPAVTKDTVYYAVFTAVPAQKAGPENAVTEELRGEEQLSDPQQVTYYTVKFTDGLGKTLSTQQVESGKAASAPKNPVRKGYDFKGWDKDFSSVTANITVNAKWAAHVHRYGAWTVTKQANYFQTGTRVRKCSCGQTQTETVPKLVAKNRWIGYGGKLYYFDGNGKLYKGWHKMVPVKSTREQWCYFNRNTGAFVKGIVNTTKNKWVEADGYRFYFYYAMRPIGAGFQVINGRLYYMDNWDAMKTGTFRASDGKTYTANSDGTIWGMPYYIHKYKTFILIDKSDQRLYYYVNKNFNMSAGVVTGLKGVHDTPRGTYYVRSKLRNIYLTGPTWRSYVNYWMAFIGSSYGIHDATWRSTGAFSNNRTYLYDGSHGCVNMSLNDASKLYYRVDIGTTVIVQE